jgi:hypothetical protein
MKIKAVYRTEKTVYITEKNEKVDGYSCAVVVDVNPGEFINFNRIHLSALGQTEEEAKNNAIAKFDQFVEILHDVEIEKYSMQEVL